MSKNMNEVIEDRIFSLSPQLFKVVAIYDDVLTRERAMRVCDYLISLLWEDAELKFHWWRTDFFRDAGLSKMAAHNAAEADLIILSSSDDTAISSELEIWFDSWVDQRGVNEGALVNLITPTSAAAGPTYRDDFLREISWRSKLDLLTVSETGNQPFLEVSVEIKSAVSRTPMNSHFGLNE